MDFSDLFTALGLAFVLEGVVYALFPDAMRQMMAQVLALPSASVRWTGLVVAAVGVGIVWLIRG